MVSQLLLTKAKMVFEEGTETEDPQCIRETVYIVQQSVDWKLRPQSPGKCLWAVFENALV